MQPNETDLFQYESFLIPPAPPTEDVEDEDSNPIETVDANGKKQLIGYCMVWGAVSSVMRDGFRHRFQKGSITWSNSVAALWHHAYETPLASTDNKTLTIEEDDYGAKVTIDLDETSDGTNAFIRVKNKLVSGMSFGGKRLAYDRTDDPKIINVTAFIAQEISLTIVPAMTETNVVTADQKDDLNKNVQTQKDSQMQMQKERLNRINLAMHKPSRVLGRAG